MKGAISNRLTMKEAAAYLGHSYNWIYTQHRSLGLNGYRIGGRWFFDLHEIQAWEADLRRHSQAKNLSNSKVQLQSGRVSFSRAG